MDISEIEAYLQNYIPYLETMNYMSIALLKWFYFVNFVLIWQVIFFDRYCIKFY